MYLDANDDDFRSKGYKYHCIIGPSESPCQRDKAKEPRLL